MKSSTTRFWPFVLLSALIASPAAAHVILEKKETVPGMPYKAVFVVPHGCKGSATVRLQVTIPEGVLLVKPMAKPEWTIEFKRGPYARPYSSQHGAKFTEGVTEVTWSGRLPDALYDEFVLSTFVSGDLAAGSTLYFPAVQTCEKGEHRWTETSGGHGGDQLGEPAPSLTLIPPGARQ